MNLRLMDPAFMGSLGGTALWTPAQITTALWLDAADVGTITASGSEVIQINDKSGNARNFTGASGTRPLTGVATLNGNNVLIFSADYLTSASSAATWTFLHNATGSSVFIVATAGTSTNPNAVYGFWGNNGTSTASNPGIALFYDDRSFVPRNNALVHQIGRGLDSSPVAVQSLNNLLTPNSANVLAVLGNPSSATLANRSIITINGSTEQKTNTDSSALSTAAPTFNFQVGAAGNNVAPLTGAIAEMIIISGLVSSITRQLIDGYLAHKWGLAASFPGDHPYKILPPYA
jgi:hypothetical protein